MWQGKIVPRTDVERALPSSLRVLRMSRSHRGIGRLGEPLEGEGRIILAKACLFDREITRPPSGGA